jgi:hypothetical protein
MGGSDGPDQQGDQILITGLNNNGKNLPDDDWNLDEGEIWTDYDPKNATIRDDRDYDIVAGNSGSPQEGWRIWWKGATATADHAYYIEIDLNRKDTITFQKNRKLQIEFTIDAPWPNPGSKPPYTNYQNKTGNKIGVQIYSKNTDARPTATKAPLAVETTLGTYFKGRAPNPDNPYPTVGSTEQRITITYDDPRENIYVRFSNAKSAKDWIGISRDGSETIEIKRWFWVDGTSGDEPETFVANGSLTFYVKGEDFVSGDYTVYFMENGGYNHYDSVSLTLPLPLAQGKKRGQTASKTDEIMAELESLLAKLKELHEKI